MLLPFFIPFYFFVIGTMLGSFANVCIYRLPLNKSIVTPRSYCPQCLTPISAWENIPIFSYVLLRGKCKFCKNPIPLTYPLVELITGILVLMLYFKFKITPIFFIYIFLFLSLIIITVIDLEHQIIPDVITLPGIILGLLINFFLGQGIINYLIGSLVGGGLFFLVAVMSKGGMGGGDIKLISMLGAFLGWFNILLTILISSFLGAVIGLALIIIKKKKRKDPIPFGPFIALGAMIVIFWGRQLTIWYQHLFL